MMLIADSAASLFEMTPNVTVVGDETQTTIVGIEVLSPLSVSAAYQMAVIAGILGALADSFEFTSMARESDPATR
jgi:hypothetical protein